MRELCFGVIAGTLLFIHCRVTGVSDLNYSLFNRKNTKISVGNNSCVAIYTDTNAVPLKSVIIIFEFIIIYVISV